MGFLNIIELSNDEVHLIFEECINIRITLLFKE